MRLSNSLAKITSMLGAVTLVLSICASFGLAKPNLKTVKIYLPGHTKPSTVKVEVHRGIAVLEGDIELGPIDQLKKRKNNPSLPDKLFKKWKKSKKVHGRMAVRNLSRYLWPNKTIPYLIDSAFSQPSQTGNKDMRGLIREAISTLNKDTALSFRPKRASDCNYVRIVYDGTLKGPGRSPVGMQGGEQKLRLKHTARSGNVMHEFLHAAGFYHTHSRPDRDNYIEVKWDNIDEDAKHNFNKQTNTSIAKGPYSVNSIMHYSSWGFPIDKKKPTIIQKNGPKKWYGFAPFCAASKKTCTKRNLRFVKSSKTGGGHRCWFGKKVQCQSYTFNQNRSYIPKSDQQAIRDAYLNVSTASVCGSRSSSSQSDASAPAPSALNRCQTKCNRHRGSRRSICRRKCKKKHAR